MKTRSQTTKSKRSRNVSKKRIRSQQSSLKYGDGSLDINGWTVCRKTWNSTQINTSYKAIKRRIEKMKINTNLTKDNENDKKIQN